MKGREDKYIEAIFPSYRFTLSRQYFFPPTSSVEKMIIEK